MADRVPLALKMAAVALMVFATGFGLRAAWESPHAVQAQQTTTYTTTSTSTASPTTTTASPAPTTTSASPSATASPNPSKRSRDRMLNSGGPAHGPVPLMPGGKCPPEYPVRKGGACYVG